MGLRRVLWALAWGSAAFLVAAFLVGYAAPHLPPVHFWWTDLFAVLLPVLGGAVGLLGGVLVGQGVYRQAWGPGTVGAALLLLVAVRFGPGFVGDAPGSDAETLRVMTFNLPPAFAHGSAREWTLAELVQREVPTMLALQEAWIQPGASPRGSPEFASWPLRVLTRDSIGYTLPRLRPSEARIYRPVVGTVRLDSMSVHPLPPSGDTNPRARYTRTYFTWEGHPAVLYNVHLHTVGPRPWELLDTEPSLRRWQAVLWTYRDEALHRADQARRIRRHIERETRPVLVAGDFNSTPHQWAYRHLAQGLQAAGGGGTFPAWWPLVQIDHVLAGPAWRIDSAPVPGNEAGAVVSDHRPLVARVRWRDGYEE
ncbi:endonuclease/exonuclease/phosphatase family protein [Salinibacter altiplanensis]|uniref:endonuclease/exonuclease/phosphatase family protein n=1 Tax=Salinibacter altiplanensis TaxID=1803181 RepID=UPI000C9F4A9F|nr:endonuclease/exonuclease/phosphatase family protein [Salinibacter altiplanensis]